MIQERSYGLLLLLMALRYFFAAGLAFWVFYVLFRKRFARVKIQKVFPKNADYRREIGYSLLTMCIFAAYALLVFRSPLTQYSRIYRDLHAYSAVWFFASVLLCILIHDTYFYWSHRLMHDKRIFRFVHLVHHKSVNPSPWAAYAFHPLEAVVEGGVIVVIVLLIPVHPLAIGMFLLFMLSFNIYGHLGYELYPRRFRESAIGQWLTTSTSHNRHHRYFKGNYGLYFAFWDRLMGTTQTNKSTAK